MLHEVRVYNTQGTMTDKQWFFDEYAAICYGYGSIRYAYKAVFHMNPLFATGIETIEYNTLLWIGRNSDRNRLELDELAGLYRTRIMAPIEEDTLHED